MWRVHMTMELYSKRGIVELEMAQWLGVLAVCSSRGPLAQFPTPTWLLIAICNCSLREDPTPSQALHSTYVALRHKSRLSTHMQNKKEWWRVGWRTGSEVKSTAPNRGPEP